jgi:hypothetical protein
MRSRSAGRKLKLARNSAGSRFRQTCGFGSTMRRRLALVRLNLQTDAEPLAGSLGGDETMRVRRQRVGGAPVVCRQCVTRLRVA